MKQYLIIFFISFFAFDIIAGAQVGDKILHQHIRTVKLYKSGDQTSFPALTLTGSDALELHFDDLEGDLKNYYYTFQLCNADWTPSLLRSFEYIRGFQNVRLTTYRNSSLATVRYMHYQALVPDRNATFIKSGNYLLKVFLNGDTTQLAFTKRFVVVDNKTSIAAQLQQPFNARIFKTHQKLQIAVNTDNRIRLFSPQDLKIVVLQNNNWSTSLFIDRPTISRGNYFEYNDEAITAIPAAKEWRWIDLRSYRLLSDRMQHIDAKGDTAHVFIKPDASRVGQVYVYYRDLNGNYTLETLENINPYWQGDYGRVHFTYFPPGNKAFEGRDVYVFGELTNYGSDTAARMIFNEQRGAYEKSLLLKQGFYNYLYTTLPKNNTQAFPDFSGTEGDYWATENIYTVLVYYRPFGGRSDELIGITSVSSVFQRPGF